MKLAQRPTKPKKAAKFAPSTTQIIMLSFLGAILLGSALLVLPFSSKSGESVDYIDALFTAVSATCVTGLVTLPTVATWSVFGQIVILILIQIGGLGVITITAGLMVAIHRKMGLKDSQLLSDALNVSTLSGLAEFVKKMLLGTFIIEGVGALMYMIVFIPDFGAKGIWISIFNSVSAFCNAGIDIVAENSLCNYATNPLVNIVTCLLIILGGLGYVVWWDIIRVLKDVKRTKFRCVFKLTLHSKIVLVSTFALILIGGVSILAFEYNNPLTLKNYNFFDKMQIAFFQSITTRTAGFATLPQENLTNASSIICIILMFIGGSPVGTAGGIKTVTIVVLFATTIATVRSKNEVTLFQRNLSKQVTRKAVAVAFSSFIIVALSTILLSLSTDAPALDVVFETVSATATVGLSRNLTSSLNVWGKLILSATMYFGRIGPISLATSFNLKKENINIIKNPTEDVRLG
ncbi:MAG: potassium transporter KtrB [Clostridia bacterium]|nr:potassium transporter KtrB [Clostridia bacterium]